MTLLAALIALVCAVLLFLKWGGFEE